MFIVYLVVTLALGCTGLLDPGPADFSELRPEKVAGGFTFTEGPVWSPAGFLLFSDTRASRLYRYLPGDVVTVFREPSNRTNGNSMDRGGRFYHCELETRRLTRARPSGEIEVLLDRWEGKRLNSPNDVVVRSDGHIYFTDPAFSLPQSARELDFYGVYHLAPDGKAEIVARYGGRPNGVALSPDQTVLYVANTDNRLVRAYHLNQQGRASGERVLIPDTGGPPDGLRVDVEGNLYVAVEGISVFTPEGKPLGIIPVPEAASNCAFGDSDLKTLYITARTSLYRVRVPVAGFVPYWGR
jgi:sugar lactone lactonase YvrE